VDSLRSCLLLILLVNAENAGGMSKEAAVGSSGAEYTSAMGLLVVEPGQLPVRIESGPSSTGVGLPK